MAFSALLWSCLLVSLTHAKHVDLGYAKYSSDLSLAPGVTSFLGLRYAAPPTGALRFSHPIPPPIVLPTQNATARGPACPQYGPIDGFNLTSPYRNFSGLPTYPTSGDFVWDEDCLFLDVHVPTEVDHNSTLPVVIWIFGGGYDGGGSALYPAESFVHDSNYGVVSVQFQHRLGVFGFLAGSEVKAYGSLNAGLLDQEFAFKWVQRHISKFGGDPRRVTIWGESSGAGSVLQHIVANGGETNPPLFRAAIMNSLFLPFQYPYDDPISEAIYDAVVSGAGCTGSKNSLSCLRAATAASLLAIDQTISIANFMGVFTFVPVVDGVFIRERPSVLLDRKQINTNTLLAVTNIYEGNTFTDPAALIAANFTLTEYITQLFPRMHDEQIVKAVSIYSNIPNTNLTTQAALVMGEAILVCPTYYTLDAFPKTSSWKAEFAVPPALHGSDLSYEFSGFGIPPTVTDENLLRTFRQMFFSFVDSPEPTDLTPKWPAWGLHHDELYFGVNGTNQLDLHHVKTDSDILDRCLFWHGLATTNNQ